MTEDKYEGGGEAESESKHSKMGSVRTQERKWLGSHPSGSLPSAPQMWCSGEGETDSLEMSSAHWTDT